MSSVGRKGYRDGLVMLRFRGINGIFCSVRNTTVCYICEPRNAEWLRDPSDPPMSTVLSSEPEFIFVPLFLVVRSC